MGKGKGSRTSLGCEKILRERSIFEDINLELRDISSQSVLSSIPYYGCGSVPTE